ncbi:hypothetical protein N0V90_008696 [Kalmusia sp. IMI 367209]|nr:hypothetical protein N0V90_008696 [Kalmusia sp. IMI 367209]
MTIDTTAAIEKNVLQSIGPAHVAALEIAVEVPEDDHLAETPLVGTKDPTAASHGHTPINTIPKMTTFVEVMPPKANTTSPPRAFPPSPRIKTHSTPTTKNPEPSHHQHRFKPFDPYEALGFEKQRAKASTKDLLAAKKQLVRLHHPDKQAGKPDDEKIKAEQRTATVNAAWDILGDPERRAAYDKTGITDVYQLDKWIGRNARKEESGGGMALVRAGEAGVGDGKAKGKKPRAFGSLFKKK